MSPSVVDDADASTRKRFKNAKERSRERQDLTELTHDEFLDMLLDVWCLHERERYTPESETAGFEVTV